MKKLLKIHLLVTFAIVSSATTLRAQWDTLEIFHSPNIGGMNDIHFVGSTGYVVGSQQVMNIYGQTGIIQKTTDGGLTWSAPQSIFSLGIDTIIELRSVYFISPSTGYVAAICVKNPWSATPYYSTILKTTNGGLTWSVVLSTENQMTVQYTVLFNSIQFMSPTHGFIAASNQTTSATWSNSGTGLVYVTMDGGISWNSSQTSATSLSNTVHFNSSGIGCAAGGVTFNRFGSGPYFDHTTGEIARSTDWGLTWTTVFSSPDGIIDMHFPSSQIGYALISGNSQLLKTTDGGLTWNALSSLFGRCIYFSNDTTGFIGNYLGIFKTTDGGITWNAEVVPSIPSAEFCTFTASTAVSYYALCDTITNGNGAIYGNFPASSCTVFTGPDTTFCQTQGQLLATPGTPGSNYVFSWSPATGLSDPNAQNPYVNYVSNQQYVVTMTDTVTLCSATDTIVVSAFNLINSPQYFCGPDSVLLDFGPGATLYDWQFFTDTAGNVTTINQNTQTYWATTQGYYTGYATFPGCGSLTSNVQAIDTCALFVWALNVWPGDCNYDLIANVADALYIGLGYGTTGATRPGANNSWTAQPMNDWTQNFTTSNYKHADCDGNGIIDANDTLAIFQNYGQTHPYRLSAPQELPASTPTLELVANYDTVGYQTLVTIDIRLGNSTVPVDSIYGISFRLRTDFNLIDTTLTVVNLNNTWLGTPGTDMFHFRKSFPSAGVVDIAECGTDHQNRLNGQGSIGSLLIVTTDNVSGISVCHFEASDITAVTISEAFLTVAAVNDSVVIDPTFLTSVPSENAGGFSMYPNPGTTQVTIRTNNAAQLIEICDMTGRIISTTNVTGYTTTIDLEDFASSVYFVRVTNGNFVSTQKLTIAN